MICVGLPQLGSLDGIYIPDNLQFTIPSIPTKMLQKALRYVEARHSRVRAVKETDADGDDVYRFFMLSLSQTK